MSFNVTIASYSRLQMMRWVPVMIYILANTYKEFLNYIQEFTPHTLLSSAWTLTTNLGSSLFIGPLHIFNSLNDY